MSSVPPVTPLVEIPEPAPRHDVVESVRPVSVSPPEPLWRRVLFGAVAVAIVVGYFVASQGYWVPAHGGVDQNGYLVGAKNLLQNGSMVAQPGDAFGFVGRMWVTGKTPGTYYPKYPIGLPAIYAGAMALGGVKLIYLVNPVAMSLALLATYLTVARLVGTFYAVLATLVVATSPVTMGLTNNPNSHATALCAVAWGMFLLLSWWERPKERWHAWGRVVGAGLLLGCAVTIRYTEGLLLLPIGIVISFVLWDTRIRHWLLRRGDRLSDHPNLARQPWSWKADPIVQSFALLFSWGAPVGALLVVNKTYFGTWTGYDPTNESTGFLWSNLAHNWDTMLRQFYVTGLAFLFPLAMVGLAIGFRHDARRATVLAAWALPNVFIYTAYYWAPDGLAIGYSRFFLTIFPALAVSGAIAMQALDGAGMASTRKLLWSCAIALVVGAAAGALLGARIKDGWGALPGAGAGSLAGVVLCAILSVRPAALVAVAGCTLSLVTSVTNAETDLRNQISVQKGGEVVTRVIPAGSVVFSKDNLMHHLQLLGDWKFYPLDLFSAAAVTRLGEQSDDPDEPQPFQVERAKTLYELLKNDNNSQLARRQNELMDRAMLAGQRVFVVVTKREFDQGRVRFLPPRSYDFKVIETWDDPPVIPNARGPRVPARPRQLARPIDRQAVWQVVEVTRHVPPATTQATSRPTTRAVAPPSTAPVKR